ncbi:ABC transporter permease [Vallitalea guaymasensis]|uniref:ABC transporter permease n=1 Tax=Vallitalea guaymasensis TaxID=1185412 RepID=UPI002352F3EC|nr:ABC transporter permease [Vallitalea guaymasensis]
MKAFRTFLTTELKLAIREFSGIFFAIILPVGIMLLLGTLYGNKTISENSTITLIQQVVPAVLTIGICASGLMGIPITVSGYREKKILKRFQITPTTPLLLLGVQFAANLIIALVSSTLVLITGIVVFGYRMVGNFFYFLLMYLVITFAIYSLGIFIASVSNSVKTANLLCTLIYFPMLFLSGATIPYEIMPKTLKSISNVMPLTQGIKVLKGVSLGNPVSDYGGKITFLLIVGLICIIISIKTFRYDYRY